MKNVDSGEELQKSFPRILPSLRVLPGVVEVEVGVLLGGKIGSVHRPHVAPKREHNISVDCLKDSFIAQL